MRLLLLLALLAPLNALDFNLPNAHSPDQLYQNRLYEKEIIEVLECIRKLLRNGFNNTLPILDPFQLNNVYLNLDELNLQGLSGSFSLNDFTLTGISDWDLEKLNIDIIVIPPGGSLKLEISWPSGIVIGTYDLNVDIFGHKITGGGDIKGFMDNLNFIVEGKLNLFAKVAIQSPKFKVALSAADFIIEGLSHNGEDLSKPISEGVQKIPEILKDVEKQLDNIIDKLIELINQWLKENSKSGASYDIPFIGECLAGFRN